jgi:glycosyltransferase involved in cell wall biosynthesis/peptidoglycan/xylan/chitin deacetylase (PgdA/CDA1 family)
MFGHCIKLLALMEAGSLTGPARNLIDFAGRARNALASTGSQFSVDTAIATFQRVGGESLSRRSSRCFDRGATGGQSRSFIEIAQDAGLEVHLIAEGFRFDLRVVSELVELIKRIRPDLIQTHSVKSHFLVRSSGLARKHPWVAFHHGYTSTDVKMRVYNQLDRWSLRGARRIITVSNAFARQLQENGIGADKIRIVQNAVDPACFRGQDPVEVKMLRQRLGICDGSRMVLAVGRLSAEKGHVHLLQAFAMLVRDHQEHDARLVMVGDGPEGPALFRMAASLGLGERVIMTGHIGDTRPYYLAADVMALPSLTEGSPNVLLEAMAAGVPVAASRVGGVPEIITDGVSGLLVEARDSGALFSALHTLLADPRLSESLAENAKAVVATHYTPVIRARSLIDIYSEVTTGENPADSRAGSDTRFISRKVPVEAGPNNAISKQSEPADIVQGKAASGDRGKSDRSRALLVQPSRYRRVLKNLMYVAYLYSGYVALLDLVLSVLGRSRAIVVYYHRIGAHDVLSKPSAEFQSDLAYLRRHYECITLAELCERLGERTPFRRRAAVITFDDGYQDNYANAAPLLKAAGLGATFFVATGYIGTTREFPHDHRCESATSAVFPKLGWADLRAMEIDGFEIGSHTVNHTNLAHAEAGEIQFEVESSLRLLNHQLGERPRAFSFPWGTPADISDEALRAVRGAGYYAACSAYGGANTVNGDRFRIRRIDVGNGSMGRLATRARMAGFGLDHFKYWMGRLRLALRKHLNKLTVRGFARSPKYRREV